MSELFADDHRTLQDRFGTRAMADRLEETDFHTGITARERSFIESRDMMFLSTIDHEGRPTVSYKGGDPGFLKVADDNTLLFPSYDGNGMYLSMGNIAGRGQVGILLMDFETPQRLRLQGEAELTDAPDALAHWVKAQLAVRVTVTGIWVNCPRYVHRYQKVEASRYVPRADKSTPLAGWKRIDNMAGTLSPEDELAVRHEGTLTEEEWSAMVDAGDREA